jgi:hypothetical protein
MRRLMTWLLLIGLSTLLLAGCGEPTPSGAPKAGDDVGLAPPAKTPSHSATKSASRVGDVP